MPSPHEYAHGKEQQVTKRTATTAPDGLPVTRRTGLRIVGVGTAVLVLSRAGSTAAETIAQGGGRSPSLDAWLLSTAKRG